MNGDTTSTTTRQSQRAAPVIALFMIPRPLSHCVSKSVKGSDLYACPKSTDKNK